MRRPSQVVAGLERRGAAAVRRLHRRAAARLSWVPSPAVPAVTAGSAAPPETTAPAPVDPYAATQRAVGATLQPEVPLPDGLSLPGIEAMMRSVSIDGSPRGELDHYVADSLWRFLYTWDLVRNHDGPALELGANPYFTTILLREHTALDLTLANYFGPEIPERASQELVYERPDGSAAVASMGYDHFDVEHDRFPYDDETFDVVLFCEIVEHLLEDPVATLSEINRVLRPGGTLVLTTPNVCRLENVVRITVGDNIYDPYSGFGPYGRHNREYTGDDLAVLTGFCGFVTERSFTADSHPWVPASPELLPVLAPHLAGRRDQLGHYTFVRARKVASPREGRPASLYRSLPPGVIVNDHDVPAGGSS